MKQELDTLEGITHRNSVDQLRTDLASRLFNAILAFDAVTQVPAGFALYSYRYFVCGGRGMHMNALYTREAQRGRGLAKMLLRELATIAIKEQLDEIHWKVREENAEARGFFHKVLLFILVAFPLE